MDTFNPKAIPGAQIFHSLIDLLNHLSPQFKKNFAILNRKRFIRHPFERIGTPFQVKYFLFSAVFKAFGVLLFKLFCFSC